MRKLILVVLVFLVVVVTVARETQKYQPDVPSGSWTGNITVVYLEDGTKCAVYTAPFKGGLSCNWRTGELDD